MSRRLVTLEAVALAWTLIGCMAFPDFGRAQEEDFTFAVVSDPHSGEPARWRPQELGSHVERFLRCIERMEALPQDQRPDFMLILGDIHLWELRKHLDRVKIPIHVIAGNHESGDKKKEIRELFPEDFQIDGQPSDYYSFVHKGVRFIGVCDAGAGGDHIGHLASEDFRPRGQCSWLERQLSEGKERKVLFAHIPIELAGKDEDMYLGQNDSRFLLDLIRKHGPEAMFFGHLHLATVEKKVDRTRCFMVRSCAWNFNEAPVGFLLVKVTAKALEIQEILTSD